MSPSPHTLPTPRSGFPRWSGALEALLLVLPLLAINWEIWRWLGADGRWKAPVRGAALALLLGSIAFSVWRRRQRLSGAGLDPASWFRGWWSLLAFTAVGVAAIGLVGALLEKADPEPLTRSWVASYGYGVLRQQIGLQVGLNNMLDETARRMQLAHPLAFSVTGSSLLFALLHLPNPGLTAISLPAAIFWTAHFRRHLNLPALMASQLALGATAMALLGQGPLLRLRVGRSALELLQ